MSYPSKPATEYINQLRYFRHKQKLATIGGDRPQPQVFDPLTSAHRLRHHSYAFHQQEQEDSINHENDKLLNKLLEISKRKKSVYAQTRQPPKMVTYQNPARRKRQKMITESNLRMAERLVAKQSFFDHRTMMRSIDEYEQLKKTMINNRRALYVSTAARPSLPSLSKKKETNNQTSMKRKIQLELEYEEEPKNNPEFNEKEPVLIQ